MGSTDNEWCLAWEFYCVSSFRGFDVSDFGCTLFVCLFFAFFHCDDSNAGLLALNLLHFKWQGSVGSQGMVGMGGKVIYCI